MTRRSCVCLIAFALAACGQTAEHVPAPTPSDTPQPLSRRDPEAYRMDPGTAVREAPSSMKNDVQRAIVCTMDRERRETGTAKLDAETIRSITRRMSEGADLSSFCSR